ncbi:hypothetical protein AE937_15170 [Bacteroides fragilis]|uniref:Transmembrane protein n=1 Tax=Bacteroides fragilis TaxID=817 RepID=A0A413K6K4_BACFG|nr:hypothetical protein [Bacteroides fragilis]RGY71918.1 hypothetical protein DXA27_01620 [Bacteroides fragilis]
MLTSFPGNAGFRVPKVRLFIAFTPAIALLSFRLNRKKGRGSYQKKHFSYFLKADTGKQDHIIKSLSLLYFTSSAVI